MRESVPPLKNFPAGTGGSRRNMPVLLGAHHASGEGNGSNASPLSAPAALSVRPTAGRAISRRPWPVARGNATVRGRLENAGGWCALFSMYPAADGIERYWRWNNVGIPPPARNAPAPEALACWRSGVGSMKWLPRRPPSFERTN